MRNPIPDTIEHPHGWNGYRVNEHHPSDKTRITQTSIRRHQYHIAHGSIASAR